MNDTSPVPESHLGLLSFEKNVLDHQVLSFRDKSEVLGDHLHKSAFTQYSLHTFYTTNKNKNEEKHPYPFLPPFLRDSAGVLGGEGERLLFFPAELALRSLRSGVREDWSDKPRAAQGARDGGWEKERQNERMERLHTQGGETVGERP